MARPMARRKKRKPDRAARRPAKSANRTRAPGRGIALPPLRGFLVDHARVSVASLGRIARHPLSTLMTVAVIGIALALPAGLHLVVANGRALSGHWEGAAELSVFLEKGVALGQAEEIAADLRRDPAVEDVGVIAADDALAEFREYSGFGAAMDALTENPIPHVLVVRPSDNFQSPEALDKLRRMLSQNLPADLVQADTEWVARLQGMLDVVRRVVLLAGLMLAVGVVIIVGNTIRLDIQNRRDEIEVTKLIGATDAFIRRPFLYTGLWYGLLGGLLALLLVAASLWSLDEPVRRLSGLYGSGFRLRGPGAGGSLVILVAGIALGWLGSWASATRNMRRIEPGSR